MSVYDLRDHPFFQFRPGTMVVRVANFTGADRNCTAGQIIDNYVEGKIKVWWIDGHVSMCWPQDLFEVAQYDGSDWENDSADSWETESENSDFGAPFRVQLKGPTSIESQIVTNMYKARGALSLLEDLLYTHCFLQDVEVSSAFFYSLNFMKSFLFPSPFESPLNFSYLITSKTRHFRLLYFSFTFAWLTGHHSDQWSTTVFHNFLENILFSLGTPPSSTSDYFLANLSTTTNNCSILKDVNVIQLHCDNCASCIIIIKI